MGFGLLVVATARPSPHTQHAIDPLEKNIVKTTREEERFTFTMGLWKALLVLTLGALPASDAATKLRRVKAGKHYASHDPVHIVVNKVG